jgi:tetratricopeptide (TPR) repeat protein
MTDAEPYETLIEPAIGHFKGSGRISVTPQKLGAFLEETAELGGSPSRRLRELAIRLEREEFEQGWAGLAAIYEAAAKADGKDPLVFHSWGIAASEWTQEWMTRDLASREVIAREAEKVLHIALELAPDDSPTAEALGRLFYNHPSRFWARDEYRSRAIEWFNRALEWDASNVMAQLYLAHCYHDRKDWARAITEYEKVNLDQLARDWPAWQATKCKEQLAYCYAAAGREDEAVRRFTALLDEVEPLDDETLQDRVINIDEMAAAAAGLLNHLDLRRRVWDLARRLGQFHPNSRVCRPEG